MPELLKYPSAELSGSQAAMAERTGSRVPGRREPSASSSARNAVSAAARSGELSLPPT